MWILRWTKLFLGKWFVVAHPNRILFRCFLTILFSCCDFFYDHGGLILLSKIYLILDNSVHFFDFHLEDLLLGYPLPINIQFIIHNYWRLTYWWRDGHLWTHLMSLICCNAVEFDFFVVEQEEKAQGPLGAGGGCQEVSRGRSGQHISTKSWKELIKFPNWIQ